MQQYAYSAFGKIELITDQTGADVTDAPPIENSFSFTGREYDSESGCYYYRARYYCAEMKRFIGRDPIGFGGGDVNLYRYVFNNPLNRFDPTGLAPGESFSSAEEAGIDALNYVRTHGDSFFEQGGRIILTENGYTYDVVSPGGPKSIPMTSDVNGFVGTFHTHPDDYHPSKRQENFSLPDLYRYGTDLQGTNFLGTPSGQIKVIYPGLKGGNTQLGGPNSCGFR